MMTSNQASRHLTYMKAGSGVAALLLTFIPSTGSAIEWTGGSGPFGTAGNWAGGVIPEGLPAAIVNGGSASIEAEKSFSITTLAVDGYVGTGSVVHSGGCLSATAVAIGGNDFPGGRGAGIYTMINGTLKSRSGEVWIGSRGGSGSLALSGSALVSSFGRLSVGREGAMGTVRLTESSVIEVTNSDLAVGCNSNGRVSSLVVSDSGRVSVSGDLWVGWQGNNTNRGVVTADGNARIETGRDIIIGRSGGAGTFTAAGNAVVDAGGTLMFGSGAGSSAEVAVSGDAHVHAHRQIWIGDNGGSARVVVDGGCLCGHASVVEDPSGAGIAFKSGGELVLNGGELCTPGFSKAESEAGAKIIFNGGTVRASGVTSAGGFFAHFASGDLMLERGGLIFDTEEQAVTIEQSLQGVGPLIKLGTGSLSIAGHAGDCEVADGTLILPAPVLSDFHTLRIAGAASRVQMSHSQVDRISRLVIDGVVQPAGNYVAPGSPNGGVQMDRLSGGGTLLVSHGAEEYLFSDWAMEHLVTPAFEADPDGDGLPNGIEHILGTDPLSPTASPLHVSRPDSQSLVLWHPLAERVAADVSRGYEWSRDLTEWRRSGESDSSGLALTVSEMVDSNSVRATFSSPLGIPECLFLRITARQKSPGEAVPGFLPFE